MFAIDTGDMLWELVGFELFVKSALRCSFCAAMLICRIKLEAFLRKLHAKPNMLHIRKGVRVHMLLDIESWL